MYNASDLRKGLKIEIDGVPYVITDFNFVKPGKGQALYNCKLKNMLNNTTLAKTFRSSDKIDSAHLIQKTVQYSYSDGDRCVFMDDNYEQISVPGSVLGDARGLLVEDLSVEILFHNDEPIDVTLPNFVEKTVAATEPGVRGDTATNVLKPATLDGGYEIQVPLFVNENDVIKVDTRTGKYADRVSKR
jgi:elongation factor P